MLLIRLRADESSPTGSSGRRNSLATQQGRAMPAKYDGVAQPQQSMWASCKKASSLIDDELAVESSQPIGLLSSQLIKMAAATLYFFSFVTR